ncbi:MAG: cytochrome d ubiquinol oxidase subunit II [Gemmatimonadota bacterium]
MELSLLLALAMGVALNLYLLLGGADFGGGVWDLFATGPRRDAHSSLIERAIGPIWEANHVWLILVIVLLFTAFPPAFSTYMIVLHIPMTVALIGIVLRGSSFAFRSYGAVGSREQRRWGRVFAVASTVTPVVLGMCVGALAAGRVRLVGGVPELGFVGSWLAPFPFAVGAYTLALFSLLAAVYLTCEAEDPKLREDFRRRALLAALATGAIAGLAVMVSRSGAPRVWETLVTDPRALVFHAATGAAALGAIWALLVRRFHAARVLAIAQASLILWGWLVSQYPYLVVPDLTIAGAAAPERTLRLVAIALVAGGALIVPAFAYLFVTFNKFRGGAALSARPEDRGGPA